MVKDIFIIPTEDVKRNYVLLRESADTAKTSLNFKKKVQNINNR